MLTFVRHTLEPKWLPVAHVINSPQPTHRRLPFVTITPLRSVYSERWKVHRRGKGGNHGKGKGRGTKGQRLNEITEPPEEQWTGGSWEQWSEQSWSDWNTADSNSQTSAAAEEFQHASVGDLRLSNLGFVKHIASFQHDRLNPSQRTITFGIDTAACKTVVPDNLPASRGHLVHKDSLLGCAYSTAGRDKVYDQGKRILCTGKPVAIESRKVNCRRPLMAVTEIQTVVDGVCFGPQRQGFSFDPRTGQTIEFTLTPGGWDLTMKLEPPERGNKILNTAIQEIGGRVTTEQQSRDMTIFRFFR